MFTEPYKHRKVRHVDFSARDREETAEVEEQDSPP